MWCGPCDSNVVIGDRIWRGILGVWVCVKSWGALNQIQRTSFISRSHSHSSGMVTSHHQRCNHNPYPLLAGFPPLLRSSVKTVVSWPRSSGARALTPSQNIDGGHRSCMCNGIRFPSLSLNKTYTNNKPTCSIGSVFPLKSLLLIVSVLKLHEDVLSVLLLHCLVSIETHILSTEILHLHHISCV